MAIKDAKAAQRPAAGREHGAGKDGRRLVRDARRPSMSTASGRFWYGIWRNLRAA
ncbi:MAG: hypothetical protein HYV14_10025 [Elusimicrobia bacterium]|nr:hypothetical protein [Elusimicrobiota bacterium]